MSNDNQAQDPLEFVRNMWGNMGFPLPGFITPTLDIDELDKRIKDLKTVEHWLKMNLNMLQMTTQGLEVQRAALAAVKAMSEQASEVASDGQGTGASDPHNPFATASLWPWNFMSQQADATSSTDAPGDEDQASRSEPGQATDTQRTAKPRTTSRKRGSPTSG